MLSFSIKTIEVKASEIIREKFEKPSIANQTVSDTIPKSKTSDLKTGQVRVTSKSSTDTLDVTTSGSNHEKFSSKLTTKDIQIVLRALDKKANVVIEKKTENGSEKYIIVDNTKPTRPAVMPLIYVDGVKVTEQEMNAISPSDIESVNVLKGENAIKKYADDAKVGVVEIKLKHKN